MCRRDELSVLSFGDGLKASPHLAPPLHHSLQLKWAANFPHFLSFFYPSLPFICLLLSFLVIISGIFGGKCFWGFFSVTK